MSYDSLIFDLDGTLWDATETYAKAWCNGLAKIKAKETVTAQMLTSVMGIERSKSLRILLPTLPELSRERLYDNVILEIRSLIPFIGGKLYDGVIEGVKLLSTKYKIFIVSNCPEGLIQDFLAWSEFTSYITNEIAYGFSPKPKSENIQLLIEKYDLKKCVYIGDTDSDAIQSKKANIPFAFVSYGFSKTEYYDFKFKSFDELSSYFMNLN